MAKLSKRINAFQDKVEQGKYYSIQDAVNLLKEISDTNNKTVGQIKNTTQEKKRQKISY